MKITTTNKYNINPKSEVEIAGLTTEDYLDAVEKDMAENPDSLVPYLEEDAQEDIKFLKEYKERNKD